VWLGLLALFVSITVICYVDRFGTSLSDEQEKWGQFGDFMGGFLNPIIGVAGFVGVLYSLHQQRRQLDLQGQEIHDQGRQLASEREERVKEERLRRAWELLRAWDSTEMAKKRAWLANWIEPHADPGKEPFRVYAQIGPGGTWKPPDEFWEAFDLVFGFWSRVHSLIRAGLLTRDVVGTLLEEDLKLWCRCSARLEFTGKFFGEPVRAEWFDQNIVLLGRMFGVKECEQKSHSGSI
jgi:hypothetical protein